MADLIIREADGWEELDDVTAALNYFNFNDLWAAVGQGDYHTAQNLLEEYYDFEDDEIASLHVISEPDDIKGEHIRIWVKYR